MSMHYRPTTSDDYLKGYIGLSTNQKTAWKPEFVHVGISVQYVIVNRNGNYSFMEIKHLLWPVQNLGSDSQSNNIISKEVL